MATLECTPIELEYIRAKVVINGVNTVETPFVKSFSINKSRSSNIGTFSTSIEVASNFKLSGTDGTIQIFGGTKANYSKEPIFTGYIRRVSINPVVGKPNFFLLSLSGNDIMSKLQNKKFSRRLDTNGPGMFVTITGPVGPMPSTLTWSIDKRVGAGNHTMTSHRPDLSDKEAHNSRVRHDSHGKGTGAGNWLSGKASEIIPEPVGPGGGRTGIELHTHENTNSGGPAFGSYSIT